MVLAKADPRITELYDAELLEDPELRAFGGSLRDLFAQTEHTLLQVTGHTSLLEGPAGAFGVLLTTLRNKLDLRTPYITPLNILQVHYLKLERQISAQEESEVANPGTPKTGAQWAPTVPFAKDLVSLNANASEIRSVVEDTLTITVKGIAAGMQNTG